MTLSALTEAADARRTAEQAYRSAVLHAVQAHGTSKTASTLGVSRQAVAQLLKRAMSEEQALRARLETLDGRWNELVKWRAGSYTLKDAAAMTAWRNKQVPKRTKKGLGRLPTVKEEAFALAETELLQLIEEGVSEEGLNVEVLRREIEEAETLRSRLGTLRDEIPF